MITGIKIVSFRRPLRGHGIDLCKVRNDTQPLAFGADAARDCLSEFPDLAVGEAKLFCLAQGGFVKGRRLLLQLAVHSDDGLNGVEEPRVNTDRKSTRLNSSH